MRVGSARPRLLRTPLGVVVALCAAILAVYLAHPVIRGDALPIGPDGPVYVWWTRLADVAGLDAIRRPGVPALILALDPLFDHTAHVVTALGPVLAAAAGAAGAAHADRAAGPDLRRSLITGGLVAAFAGFLAPGWLANLAMAAVFLGAIALLAGEASRGPAVAVAAALLVAAGLAHRSFLVVGLAILAAAALALIPDARRRRAAGGRGWAIPAARLGGAVVGGGGLGLLAPLALSGAPPPSGDTSQDQLLRGSGLEGLLRTRFRERLGKEAVRLATPFVAGGSLGWWSWRGEGGGPVLRALGGAWAGVTAAGIAILWAGSRGPAARLLTFAFFLPLAAGIGAAAGLSSRRAWVRVASALAAIVFAAGSLWGWYRQRPYVEERELAVVAEAEGTVAGLPAGTPIVFLVDTRELAAGFHLARFGNVIRMALPPGRIGDARLMVGTPADLEALRPGRSSGDPEYAAIADAAFADVRPVLERAAVLILEPFNDPGYAEAEALLARPDAPAGSARISPRAILLRSPVPVTPAACDACETSSGSPLVPAPLLLGWLGLLGWGWARWGLGSGARFAAFALSPSAGLGVAILGGSLADALRLGAGAPAGFILTIAISAAGYLLVRGAADEAVDGGQDPRP